MGNHGKRRDLEEKAYLSKAGLEAHFKVAS